MEGGADYGDMEEVEAALKVVIVGDGGVGKSSLIRRYCRGVFTSQVGFYQLRVGKSCKPGELNFGNI